MAAIVFNKVSYSLFLIAWKILRFQPQAFPWILSNKAASYNLPTISKPQPAPFILILFKIERHTFVQSDLRRRLDGGGRE